MKQCCIYITTNKSGTLYIGVTSNLKKRIWEHKNKILDGFTKKYDVNNLIYFEQTENIMSAIEREKQLKKWSRQKKINLISRMNPRWKDLYDNL
jgi:putative endonuclease